MKLLRLLKESLSPSQDRMKKSYDDLVSSRRNLTSSILLSRKEYDDKYGDLSNKIKNRKRKGKGTIYSPTDLNSLQLSYRVSNEKNFQILRKVNELETDVMDLLNSRGVVVFDQDDFDEENVFIPRDQ